VQNGEQQVTPIRSDDPDSFAWGVWHRRHPILIRQVRAAFPYPPEAHRALEELLEESTSGLVRPLLADVHDFEHWQEWDEGHYGEPWGSVPFLWAESFFYRRLLEAVDYFRPGPWRGIDPFAPSKHAELTTPELEADLAALAELEQLELAERRRAVLAAALWGNRADLGFRITAKAPSEAVPEADLVADDSDTLWAILDEADAPSVHLIADNAGRELLADLVLIDHLLHAEAAASVVVHVKPQPYYVSDATGADVVDVLRRLGDGPGHAAEIGRRIREALVSGTIRLRTHDFWCAPQSFRVMPTDLVTELSAATLTIAKGDLNYRRLVGDCTWPAMTPFEELTAYFPSSVAALRTLKSDVAVGLTEARLARLDAAGGAWRTDGTHAMIQARR
jgi:hypothetical protein